MFVETGMLYSPAPAGHNGMEYTPIWLDFTATRCCRPISAKVAQRWLWATPVTLFWSKVKEVSVAAKLKTLVTFKSSPK